VILALVVAWDTRTTCRNCSHTFMDVP